MSPGSHKLLLVHSRAQLQVPQSSPSLRNSRSHSKQRLWFSPCPAPLLLLSGSSSASRPTLLSHPPRPAASLEGARGWSDCHMARGCQVWLRQLGGQVGRGGRGCWRHQPGWNPQQLRHTCSGLPKGAQASMAASPQGLYPESATETGW